MATTGRRIGAIREHRCAVCEKVELWGKGWRWVTREGELDETVCSDACERALRAQRKAAS